MKAFILVVYLLLPGQGIEELNRYEFKTRQACTSFAYEFAEFRSIRAKCKPAGYKVSLALNGQLS